MAGSSFAFYHSIPVAHCKALKRHQNTAEESFDLGPEPPFCWKTFLEFLLPEIWFILGAIAVSIFSCILSIYKKIIGVFDMKILFIDSMLLMI